MSNRTWLDVYDNSTLLRIGEGPIISVQNASIRRPLDGAGTFRVNCTAPDPRAITLLQNDRIIRIWSEDQGGIRLRGEGIITDWQLSEAPTGVGFKISGPDILEQLKRKNTLLGRIYNQDTLQDVVDDLITLAPGWSVELDASIANNIVQSRFDGLNLFKAFRSLALKYGYHIRAKLDGDFDPLTASRTIQIGPFGEDTGQRINKVVTINSETLANDSLLIPIDIKKQQTIESNNYFNTLIPNGAGEGVAALTLREAYEANGNVGREYPIQLITGPDGRTLYYISTTTYPSGGYDDFTEDPASAVKVGQYKDIAPLSNSIADRRNASEALYAQSVADLERSSEIQVSYDFILKNVKTNILPGDKVRVDYKAEIEIQGANADETEVFQYLNESGDFFVLSADERIGIEGGDVAIKVSNLDKFVEDEIELIFDTLDSMEIRNLKPNLTVGPPSPYVFRRDLFAGFPINVPIEFTDAVTELLRVRLRLITKKLVTTLSVTIPSHRHRMFKYVGDLGGTWSSSSRQYRVNAGPPFNTNLDIVTTYLGATADMYTDGESPEVSVSVANPTEDTQTPTNITIWFEGVDVTNTLFGVATLAPSGGEINVLADAGELANLLTNATGGLQQLHELEIRCASGRGAIEVVIEVFATTQAIKLPTS
ncbi:hypothetical protein C8B47_03740 [filamentous cyanobacterium CCP4]|nr:hypothetical protein C8B47_03740 [filamentous cyanobacterium CCP4]